MNHIYSVGVIGSTHRTVQCAQALITNEHFSVSWVLTPQPKPIGRQQVVTANPLHQFAQKQHIPITLIDRSIPQFSPNPVDFLLVVDFGYLIPQWLLDFPTIAPLNVHPSDLPRWRGSSPAQFVLLYGDTTSAVTLMIMNDKMDQGSVVHKEYFEVSPNWTQTEYYQHSFTLISPLLPTKILALAQGSITPQPQPLISPTPTANRLRKEDAFVDWEIVQRAINQNLSPTLKPSSSALLEDAFQHHQSWPLTLEHASQAFSPWPHLWTIVTTTKGEKRMKILATRLNADQQLILERVQIEGQQPALWNQVKNQLSQSYS